MTSLIYVLFGYFQELRDVEFYLVNPKWPALCPIIYNEYKVGFTIGYFDYEKFIFFFPSFEQRTLQFHHGSLLLPHGSPDLPVPVEGLVSGYLREPFSSHKCFTNKCNIHFISRQNSFIGLSFGEESTDVTDQASQVRNPEIRNVISLIFSSFFIFGFSMTDFLFQNRFLMHVSIYFIWKIPDIYPNFIQQGIMGKILDAKRKQYINHLLVI